MTTGQFHDLPAKQCFGRLTDVVHGIVRRRGCVDGDLEREEPAVARLAPLQVRHDLDHAEAQDVRGDGLDASAEGRGRGHGRARELDPDGALTCFFVVVRRVAGDC